ncbi:MAG: hypothetical protein LC115_09345 [Bacteroidia bacterium]|nr:hypothetical protein [Bacteroidia bacterium]
MVQILRLLKKTTYLGICWIGLCYGLNAQNKKAVLNILSHQTSDTQIRIEYTISIPGVVEFHLFDEHHRELFHDSSLENNVNNKHIRYVNRKKLIPNKVYNYVFSYKGIEYRGKFTNP